MEPAVVADATLQGQAQIWQYIFNFVDSMVLKCAVELRIADIIHSHGSPIPLSQIASDINSSHSTTPPPNINYLARIMRLLVRNKIFTASSTPTSDCAAGDILYGLTHSSMWILHDRELSLAPMVLMQNDTRMLAPWHCLSDCVREGGFAFNKAHGLDFWDFTLANPGFNRMFNDAMKFSTSITMAAIIANYKEGFESIGTLVDVGGGTGVAMADIVKAFPHIKGINFDLPHVIATAPEYEGVSHVGGDMFEAIPNADVVFMKWIMHDWNDEDSIKILKNCRKAIPEKNGKVIIADVILQPDGYDLFDNTGVVLDILMFIHASGKERTESEWKKLLEKGGFSSCKFIKIPDFLSIIEAFP